MDEQDWLAEQFEAHRTRLRTVAYRMLGSASEADDAVQDAWLRFSHTGANGVNNLSGWLTTLVARACLDLLRARASRQERPLDVHVPDPVVSRADGSDPEQQALLAEGVGLERLAFVLHDMFAVPFEEIAAIVGRSPTAARQLASRARRRVQGAKVPDADLSRQRAVVDAFFAAARDGHFAALVAVLDPDVVLRADLGAVLVGAPAMVRGAQAVAKQALNFARLSPFVRPALVNGGAGVVVAPGGQPHSVMGFTVRQGKIAEIDILADPQRLGRLDLTFLDE